LRFSSQSLESQTQAEPHALCEDGGLPVQPGKLLAVAQGFIQLVLAPGKSGGEPAFQFFRFPRQRALFVCKRAGASPPGYFRLCTNLL